MSKNLTVKNYLQVLEKTVGRDKLSKLFQYGSLFLKWYFSKFRPQRVETINRLGAFQVGCATSRRLFRFSKSLASVEQIKDILSKNKSLLITDVLSILSSIGMAIYFLCDHFVFLYAIGARKGDVTKIKKWSTNGWFFGILFSILSDLFIYYELVQKQRSAKKIGNDEYVAIKSQKRKLQLNFVKNLADLQISSYFSKHSWTSGFSDGWIGLCGCVNAVVGLYEIWPKTI
eukprot:TRINITY_DN11917_c0_g1_i1.p1 TRINITY_DN11917_c0_g1~~TRINITY_DN11917_c0_g1_i1.p1  ORF type:complete len:241 (+),score=28.56 TRINITY_DN11917_c0_g1_i1:36-725(+)